MKKGDPHLQKRKIGPGIDRKTSNKYCGGGVMVFRQMAGAWTAFAKGAVCEHTWAHNGPATTLEIMVASWWQTTDCCEETQWVNTTCDGTRAQSFLFRYQLKILQEILGESTSH